MNKGLTQKYIIERVDGKPLDEKAKYFILRYDKDPHAKKALLAYADSIEEEQILLATDIRKEVAEVWKCLGSGFGSEKEE